MSDKQPPRPQTPAPAVPSETEPPQRRRASTNPTHYTIAHSAVGGYRQGDRVPADAFDAATRARLVGLGAIAPAANDQDED